MITSYKNNTISLDIMMNIVKEELSYRSVWDLYVYVLTYNYKKWEFACEQLKETRPDVYDQYHCNPPKQPPVEMETPTVILMESMLRTIEGFAKGLNNYSLREFELKVLTYRSNELEIEMKEIMQEDRDVFDLMQLRQAEAPANNDETVKNDDEKEGEE